MPPPAGRPREFEIDEVLDRAMETFWARGYEAASVVDLLEATGLHKGSLYKAFGDKRQLFLCALQRYMSEGLERAAGVMASAGGPAGAVRAWLGFMGRLCEPGNGQRGCLALNTIAELAPHDPEVEMLIDRHATRIRGMLEEVIEQGQEAGVFRTDERARDLAEVLLAMAWGMVIDSKVAPNRARSKRIAAFAMRMLEHE